VSMWPSLQLTCTDGGVRPEQDGRVHIWQTFPSCSSRLLHYCVMFNNEYSHRRPPGQTPQEEKIIRVKRSVARSSKEKRFDSTTGQGGSEVEEAPNHRCPRLVYLQQGRLHAAQGRVQFNRLLYFFAFTRPTGGCCAAPSRARDGDRPHVAARTAPVRPPDQIRLPAGRLIRWRPGCV
jgi:hypothetical protein